MTDEIDPAVARADKVVAMAYEEVKRKAPGKFKEYTFHADHKKIAPDLRIEGYDKGRFPMVVRVVFLDSNGLNTEQLSVGNDPLLEFLNRELDILTEPLIGREPWEFERKAIAQARREGLTILSFVKAFKGPDTEIGISMTYPKLFEAVTGRRDKGIGLGFWFLRRVQPGSFVPI